MFLAKKLLDSESTEKGAAAGGSLNRATLSRLEKRCVRGTAAPPAPQPVTAQPPCVNARLLSFACVCGDRTRELKGALYEVRDLVNSQRAVASDFAVAISGAVAESQLRGLGGAVRCAAVYFVTCVCCAGGIRARGRSCVSSCQCVWKLACH